MSLRVNIFKFFSLETAKPIEAKFHVAPPWDGGMKVCSKWSRSHDQYAAMPIYGKTLKKTLKKIFFSRTKQPMTLNVGMQHRVFKYYHVYSNDHPGLTFTYFTAR